MSRSYRNGPDSIRNGIPRTKGIRNPFVASANAHKSTTMRDRRDRRANDARRSWKREDWS